MKLIEVGKLILSYGLDILSIIFVAFLMVNITIWLVAVQIFYTILHIGIIIHLRFKRLKTAFIINLYNNSYLYGALLFISMMFLYCYLGG